MGPSLIFDKSALQSLNVDQAMWLDQFYNVNVTPLFFVETLADLEKEIRSGKKPEQVVGEIAMKTPYNGYVNAHHTNLLYGELSGQGVVGMDFRPIVPGGRIMQLGDRTGVIHEVPDEIEAFNRWQKHEFLDVERSLAKTWRENLKEGAPFLELFKQMMPLAAESSKTLEDLIRQTNSAIDDSEQENALLLGLTLLNVSQEAQREVLLRWQEQGRQPIKDFAPYFRHVFGIELFYYIGTASGVLAQYRNPKTHKVDLAYLYYLPFCQIFVSNDKFQLAVAPLFAQTSQTIVEGSELNADLAKLDLHFDALSETEKSRGVFSFAMIPPKNGSYLTVQLWDKYMASTWRDIRPRKFDGTDKINPEIEQELVDHIRKFETEGVPVKEGSPITREFSDAITQRFVPKRRGKWKLFPPEVENSQKRVLKNKRSSI